MKIVNKIKFIRTCSILVILLGLIILFSTNTYSKGEIIYKSEYVCKGDTLWSIAKNEIEDNKYFNKKDIRNVVIELKKLNNLSDSNLTEGMKITIPTYK